MENGYRGGWSAAVVLQVRGRGLLWTRRRGADERLRAAQAAQHSCLRQQPVHQPRAQRSPGLHPACAQVERSAGGAPGAVRVQYCDFREEWEGGQGGIPGGPTHVPARESRQERRAGSGTSTPRGSRPPQGCGAACQFSTPDRNPSPFAPVENTVETVPLVHALEGGRWLFPRVRLALAPTKPPVPPVQFKPGDAVEARAAFLCCASCSTLPAACRLGGLQPVSSSLPHLSMDCPCPPLLCRADRRPSSLSSPTPPCPAVLPERHLVAGHGDSGGARAGAHRL